MTLGVDPYPSSVVKNVCRSYCLLSKALHDEAGEAMQSPWRIKPKMHMVQELAEYMVDELGDPSSFWAYRDEDFVGFVAEIGSARERVAQADTAARRIMTRIRALSGR